MLRAQVKHFVVPLTAQFRCAFADLCAAEGDPAWVVSHAWAAPFADTLASLQVLSPLPSPLRFIVAKYT